MESDQRALRQEIAALRHELRRVNDGLERNRTPALELQARRLRDNIVLCERELAQLDTALQSGVNKP
jgi:hypothetical protein